MKNQSSQNLSSLTALSKGLLIAVGIITSFSSWAFDSDRAWTTVGSTGTVDERSIDITLDHQNARLVSKPEGKFSSGTIRYNVTAVDNLFFATTPIMELTYKDSNPIARVFARLIKMDLKTGRGRTVLKFDSNDFPESPNTQKQRVVPRCENRHSFNFKKYAYYVDVSLSHKNNGGDASLDAIRISTLRCVS